VVFQWTGWTGDTWTLAGDVASKAFLEADGRSGLLFPPVEHRFKESAVADGSEYRGTRVLNRPLTWPLFIHERSGAALRAEQNRFLRTLEPDKVGKLTVLHPDGHRRYLDLRYEDGAKGDEGRSNFGIIWVKHQLTMVTEQPYLYGDAVLYPFTGAVPVNFFGGGTIGSSKGPPFFISSSQTLASATVTNPGDRPAWPVWKLVGPMTSFTSVLDGATIEIPISLTLGQSITIDTNPRRQTIVRETGANQWPLLSSADIEFTPVPANGSSELNLTVAGSTSDTRVEVTIVPMWWRAW
jgi:hypothetical protein